MCAQKEFVSPLQKSLSSTICETVYHYLGVCARIALEYMLKVLPSLFGASQGLTFDNYSQRFILPGFPEVLESEALPQSTEALLR